MQIAAQHAETEGRRARPNVKEGFLLDGIAVYSGGVSPRNLEPAARVEPDLADAGLPLKYGTPVAAGETPDSLFVQALPELAFAGAFGEDLG